MELTIRDWMVIVGVLLIFAVLVDAWRRVRSQRYSRVKVKLVEPGAASSARDADLQWLRELPNGGARIVRRDDLLRATGRQTKTSGNNAADSAAVPPADESGDDSVLVSGMSSSDDDAPANMDWLDDAAGDTPSSTAAGLLPRGVEPQVFMLHVQAREESGFSGEDILQILLACDLRFGDMNFFHRHEFASGRGAIQFSVANMVQPGVFDIDHMAELRTPGLIFFLTLPGPEQMTQAFDYMLETAQAVARNLGGDVLDESHSALTRQTLEHSRQKIRDLERRLLVNDH